MSATGPDRRILVLVRHAQPEASGPTDHERVLTAAGRAEGEALGEWLASLGIAPDTALVSDAARTTQTYEEMSLAAGWEVEPDLSAALYAAGPESVVDILRGVAPESRCVVVVGHNPTMATLAQLLDDGAGDPGVSTDVMISPYPPASTTVFEVTGDWSDLDEGTATIAAFREGRDR